MQRKGKTLVRQNGPEISPLCHEYRRKIYQTIAVSVTCFLGGYYQALLRLIDRKVLCGCFYLHIMPAIYALFLHRLYSLKIGDTCLECPRVHFLHFNRNRVYKLIKPLYVLKTYHFIHSVTIQF